LGQKGSILFLEIVDFFIFGGAAQRPVGRGNEPKKTGARSARARTRGQNPLVNHKRRNIFFFGFLTKFYPLQQVWITN
jgi:hypothetical protein